MWRNEHGSAWDRMENDGGELVNDAGRVESQNGPASFQIGHIRPGKAGNRYRQKQKMLEWFHKHGATKADGTPFKYGDIVNGTPKANGNIGFTAYKKGVPFQTGWSSDYFTQVESEPTAKFPLTAEIKPDTNFHGYGAGDAINYRITKQGVYPYEESYEFLDKGTTHLSGVPKETFMHVVVDGFQSDSGSAWYRNLLA